MGNNTRNVQAQNFGLAKLIVGHSTGGAQGKGHAAQLLTRRHFRVTVDADAQVEWIGKQAGIEGADTTQENVEEAVGDRYRIGAGATLRPEGCAPYAG